MVLRAPSLYKILVNFIVFLVKSIEVDFKFLDATKL